jgi:hypothetical protein
LSQIRYAITGFLILLLTCVRSGALAASTDAYASTEPSATNAKTLHAGPITLKFEDGELRYLRVGDHEIIRRIYFGVREAKFAATDMPAFSQMHVNAAEDHFAIHLTASCRGKTISYDWTGDITGSADGKIVFRTTGSAPSDGTSGRIGLCVLYGADSLAGHKFETLNSQGDASQGEFPELVSPKLIAKGFQTLRYTLGNLRVSCGIAESPFLMEDQRNWGDSSFKAYNPLPYAYPKIEKGKSLTQTLTLSVEGAASPSTAPSDAPAAVRIGLPITGARVCAIGSPDQFSEALAFPSLNAHREQSADATAITWKWTTATHLPDDDVAMENLTAIVTQARTIHSFAPRALLRVGPISLNSEWPSIVRPPGFAAAWTAGAIKQLSLANVDEAAFLDSTPDAGKIVQLFKKLTGKPMVDVSVAPSVGVDAFAVNDIGTTTLWLINQTDQPRTVTLENLSASAMLRASRPAVSDVATPLQSEQVELSAYEVWQVVVPR